jgi:hypothetical protein
MKTFPVLRGQAAEDAHARGGILFWSIYGSTQHLHGPTCGFNVFISKLGSSWSVTLNGGSGLSGHHKSAAHARVRAEKAFSKRIEAAYKALKE